MSFGEKKNSTVCHDCWESRAAAGVIIALNTECFWDSTVLQLPSSRGPAFGTRGGWKKTATPEGEVWFGGFTAGHCRAGTCNLRAGDSRQGAMHDLQTERLKDIFFHLPLPEIFDSRKLFISS